MVERPVPGVPEEAPGAGLAVLAPGLVQAVAVARAGVAGAGRLIPVAIADALPAAQRQGGVPKAARPADAHSQGPNAASSYIFSLQTPDVRPSTPEECFGSRRETAAKRHVRDRNIYSVGFFAKDRSATRSALDEGNFE